MTYVIDRQKLNAIHNQLKELVGPHGAFVLFLVKDDEESGREDCQMRVFGPYSRQIGMTTVLVPYHNELIMKKLDEQISEIREPD